MSWCDAYIPGRGKVGKKEILDTSEPEKFVDNTVKVYKMIDGVKTLIRTEEPFPEGWNKTGYRPGFDINSRLEDHVEVKEDKRVGNPRKIDIPSKEVLEAAKAKTGSLAEFAEEFNVGNTTAYTWLKHHGIPTSFKDKRKQAEEEKRQEFVEAERPKRIEADPDKAFVRRDVFEKPLQELTVADVCEAELLLEQNNPHPKTVPEQDKVACQVCQKCLDPTDAAWDWHKGLPICPECHRVVLAEQSPHPKVFPAMTDDEFERIVQEAYRDHEEDFSWPDDEPIPFVVTTLPEIQPSNYIAEHHQVAERVAAILDQKRADYGINNIRKFGSIGCLLRMSDKIERLVNLCWENRDKQPNFESIADTYQDICGYAILALIELEAGR